MIEVGFKKQFTNEYDEDKTYYFGDYENATVGDIVVVETVYGYGIGMVMATEATHPQYNNENVRRVVKVVDTAADREAKRLQKEKEQAELKAFADMTKKNLIINKIKEINGKDADYTILNQLSFDRLQKMYNYIVK